MWELRAYIDRSEGIDLTLRSALRIWICWEEDVVISERNTKMERIRVSRAPSRASMAVCAWWCLSVDPSYNVQWPKFYVIACDQTKDRRVVKIWAWFTCFIGVGLSLLLWISEKKKRLVFGWTQMPTKLGFY